MTVRVRFAPSPTGHLHIGSARTALFNWLFARHFDGVYLLRIEDTDRERSTHAFEQTILEDMAWLGLNWDEGPDIGGPKGPYRQTERMSEGLYDRYAEQLIADGRAYRCFCLPEELEVRRQEALAAGRMPKYSGKCRAMTANERKARLLSGEIPTIRFAVPDNEEVAFDDLIRGKLELSTDVIGDFIILRRNRVPTYNFAAAVDDADMAVTHVLRGEDHITNTARQLLLLEALEKNPPAFGHFSMILGHDKAKLSKRHGATAIYEYRRQGYLPEAIVNYLALLSWSSASGEEVLDILRLTEEFSLKRVSRSSAIFDGDKLKWLNSRHIRRLDIVTLTNLCLPYFVENGIVDSKVVSGEFGRLKRMVEAVYTGMETLADAVECVKVFGTVEYDREAADRLAEPGAKKIIAVFAEVLTGARDLNPDEVKVLIVKAVDILKTQGHKAKAIFQTIRLALTGRLSGPELFLLIYALGPAEARERLCRLLI